MLLGKIELALGGGAMMLAYPMQVGDLWKIFLIIKNISKIATQVFFFLIEFATFLVLIGKIELAL